ncbi:MAG: zinc ribbon domain-containing protein [Tatlockia sp.]|nr:zinc ribbon domain-containing protein [Tatlockia sp.]
MPIYEYECKNCHHHFDLMQKIGEAAAKQCPKCLEETAIRLISAAGFQLKGSGWYATDFKTKSKPESKKEEGSNEKTTDTETKTTDKKASDASTNTSSKGETKE